MSTQQNTDMDHSEIEWLILADGAEVVNGKLYVLGGGWDRITAGELPWPQHMAIAVAIRVPWMDTNRQTPIEIELADGDGASLAKAQGGFVVGRPPQATPGQPLRSQIVLNMNVAFPKLGTYSVVCRLQDSERSFPFEVAPGPELMTQLLDKGETGSA